MISVLLAEAAKDIELYNVNLDVVYAIPFVFLASLAVGALLREFVHGAVKLVLAVAFALSFSALWFVLMIDNAPWQFVIPLPIILGVAGGLSKVFRSLLKDVEKL